MAPSYTLALECTILLALWLSLGVWQRDRDSAGRPVFLALAAAAGLWALGELLYIEGAASEWVSDRVKYAGILALPPLWLGLAAHAARLDMARRVPWFPLALLVPGALLYALLFSDRWSSLMLVTVEGGEDLRGPLWQVYVAVGYAMVIAGAGILIATALRPDRGHWERRVAVGFAALIPLAGNAAFLSESGSWAYDPTPVLLAVTLLALRSAIFSGGLLETLPISQHDLMDQLPLGIVLTDRRGVVIDLNPAAERRLGMPASLALGRALDAVLETAAEEVRAEIAPILVSGRERAQLVVLDAPGPKPEAEPPPEASEDS